MEHTKVVDGIRVCNVDSVVFLVSESNCERLNFRPDFSFLPRPGNNHGVPPREDLPLRTGSAMAWVVAFLTGVSVDRF